MSRPRSFAFEPVGSDAPENVSPYLLRALVATGAHGKDYLAYSPTGSPVVVKVYRFGFGAEQKTRARFLRAVTVARSMHCEIAAPVRGAGFTMHRLWLVTEYQAGPSLADAVFQHGPLPRETVRRLAVALTRLIGELHLVGLSGRGLEPSDVVLTPDGPRVVDLGFARIEGEAGPADAADAARDGLGVPDVGGQSAEPRPVTDDIPGRYASGRTVLAQDVWDLGTVLYFAATGRMPAGDTADIVGPSVGNCPAGLRELIAASHRADPARRPGLSELAAAASTTGAPQTTAVQWQSEPWLPEGVLRDAESRAAAVAELKSRETWRMNDLFPGADPAVGWTPEPWRAPGTGTPGAAGAGGPQDEPPGAQAGSARGHGLHMWRRRSSQ